MIERIKKIILESIATKQLVLENDALISTIAKSADVCTSAFRDDKKVLFCGNGGSAADAQHIAAEFVNRYQIERPPLAALALTTDTSIITSIGNDYHFDEIFSKQIRALGKKDDIAMGISTSGNSKNVIRAINAGRKIGMFTIGLTGPGGDAQGWGDLSVTKTLCDALNSNGKSAEIAFVNTMDDFIQAINTKSYDIAWSAF